MRDDLVKDSVSERSGIRRWIGHRILRKRRKRRIHYARNGFGPPLCTRPFCLIRRCMAASNFAGMIAQLQRHMAIVPDQPFLDNQVFLAEAISDGRECDPFPGRGA